MNNNNIKIQKKRRKAEHTEKEGEAEKNTKEYGNGSSEQEIE